MILAKCRRGYFEINEGKIKAEDPFVEQVFEKIYEPFPEIEEGDPDRVLFDRIKEGLDQCSLVNYTPPKLNDDIVY